MVLHPVPAPTLQSERHREIEHNAYQEDFDVPKHTEIENKENVFYCLNITLILYTGTLLHYQEHVVEYM